MLLLMVQLEEEIASVKKLPRSREGPQEMGFCYGPDIVQVFFLQEFMEFLQYPCVAIISYHS